MYKKVDLSLKEETLPDNLWAEIESVTIKNLIMYHKILETERFI